MRWYIIAYIATFPFYIFIHLFITGNLAFFIAILPFAGVSVLGVRTFQKVRFTSVPCLTCINHEKKTANFAHLYQRWVCGWCAHTHAYTLWPRGRAFIEPCKKCGRVPKSLICWKCREPIGFDDGYGAKTSAWIAGHAPRAPALKDRFPEPIRDHLQ
jgi:hypothetical protein